LTPYVAGVAVLGALVAPAACAAILFLNAITIRNVSVEAGALAGLMVTGVNAAFRITRLFEILDREHE
jgi:hypothetical protein